MTTAREQGVDTALRPTTLAEARDALRDTPGALRFRGGGTKQGWGAPPDAVVDTVIDTTGLDALVEHSDGDMVAIAGAGIRLDALQRALAPSGQWLAVDPPLVAEGATLGGVVATNDHGPRRLRYGSPRDLVIGVTVVLADGAVARGGGRVVKNVAGFDLMRLLCGSFGTLGLMAELVVRLHPLPEASLTLTARGDLPGLCRAVQALSASPVEPTALDVAEGAVWVRLEGRPAGIEAQARDVRRLLTAEGLATEPADDEVWDRLRAAHAGAHTAGHDAAHDAGHDTAHGADGETVARAATLPDRLPAVAAALEEVAPDATLASHAALGLHSARFPAAPEGHADAVRAWRRRVAALGGTVVLRRHAPGLDTPLDIWGPEPSAIAVMRRMKASLDPDRRCAPGTFVGGI